MSEVESRPALELPHGSSLHAFMAGQVPAPGAIYRAMMPGDLETLFGPAGELRGREFMLELDGERWIATPTLGLFVTSDEHHTMVFDTGGIYARTDGQWTTIDFELVRSAC